MEKSIDGNKYTAQDISDIVEVDADELTKLALEGFAPCLISPQNIPYFKKTEIKAWIKVNLYRTVNAKKINNRFNVFVDSNKLVSIGIPKELQGIKDLKICDNYRLPPCVYFLIDIEEVVYVGKSENLYARLTTHIIEGVKGFNRVFYITIPSINMNEVEMKFIKSLKPKYNMAGLSKND